MALLIVVLLILWMLGVVGDVAGGFIHILLAVALIAFIYNMVSNSRDR